jgi:hypothetical protein
VPTLHDVPSLPLHLDEFAPPVTPDQVAMVLGQVARAHTAWWQRPRLGRLDGWQRPQRMFLRYLFGPSDWDVLVADDHGELLSRQSARARTPSRC